ncbi:unnamed protein product [Brassica rapa]|uniref:Uncharacterized protein n=1 Tax=Brassica campestris TaxID=3711 RepID=A0A3P6D6B7_BRACM|nr:unnamed protein product [Brassica rapa]VDD23206.1 unnamed protein product [Brassica rapa]
MMVSFVETLKKQEEAVDVVIVSAYLVAFFVFIISSFPYKQRIHDWQLNEFRVAVSDHKTLQCLFLFLSFKIFKWAGFGVLQRRLRSP